MNTKYPIAAIAELIGEPARAAILLALMDGRSLTAGELALIANVSAQSTSAHLSKMAAGGLLKAQSSGRHRYYRLAGSDVAHAIEALATIATLPPSPAAIPTPHALEIRTARSCYEHLAGRIAVEIATALEEENVIRQCGERDYELGRNGHNWFSQLGIDLKPLCRTRRKFARRCLDWTERKPHLAGALGTALCARTMALGWFAKRRDTRALRITHKGACELHNRFGISA
ncbi:MAG: helix-turn-helix transcriptional regulator [Candidatus Acidiferrales bacterium]